MKKIICALDFSTGALHALDYAFMVANAFEADIDMVWVDFAADASNLPAISRDLRLEVKRQFDEIMSARNKDLKSGNLSFKLKKGKVYQEVAAYAKAEQADLIIAGSHGVSGYEQFWIGSNAYRIVSYAPCPVITVRAAFDFSKGIQRIIMPIDSTSETITKVPFTAMLAREFGAEIHILALHSTPLVSLQKKVGRTVAEVAKLLKKGGIRHKEAAVQSDNITTAAIDYAVENKADLISIMTEKENSAANIMLGPYAQQMVNNAPIPVLSINPRHARYIP